MTWWQLLVFAVVLSYMSFRYINILLALGAFIGWMSLMAYNLNYPPANIVQGSTIHQWLTIGFIAIALGVMLMHFRNRGRVASSRGGGSSGGEEGTPPSYERKSLMEQSPSEYKTTAREALHPRRRR